MFNPAKIPGKVKTHVTHHKFAYTASVVAALAILLQQRNRVAFDEFLTSKGIDLQEYYCPEAYAEKLS